MNFKENLTVKQTLDEHLAVAKSLYALEAEIAHMAHLCAATILRGGKILLAGNGGSAADAQHIAAELVGRFEHDRRALPAIALTVDTSALTAIGNDYGFDFIFARQLEALGTEGDVFIGISTSGNSANIIQAVRSARQKKLTTIVLSGKNGGVLKNEADMCLIIPSEVTARIQEMHILIGHILCAHVEQAVLQYEKGQNI